MAYRLCLPKDSRIHNVFHVSLLREFIEGEDFQKEALSAAFCGDRPIAQPVEMLESRLHWRDGKVVHHVLVRWSYDASSPSWEPLDYFRKHFLTLPLEGKLDLNGGELIRL